MPSRNLLLNVSVTYMCPISRAEILYSVPSCHLDVMNVNIMNDILMMLKGVISNFSKWLHLKMDGKSFSRLYCPLRNVFSALYQLCLK